jgi:beta-N-acetylhexosaminidase
LIAIDQEGGYVDRLVQLNGRRPSAATIAETNDPATAEAVGIQDSRDLSALGFNLNLAPVVDVGRAANPQLEGRTFGDDPQDVTRLAGAYLRGLQRSASVFGALKHFPGLGGVRIDPHQDVPVVTQTREQLEAVDWPPYRALIASRDAHAVMVTHEVVRSLDPSLPATLSQRLISGVLRAEMRFDGVVITDSLSMEGITASYPQPQAAVMAIRAGADLVMGAARPREVAETVASVKRAIAAGAIKETQIDAAVRRVLVMKAALGLLPSSAGK